MARIRLFGDAFWISPYFFSTFVGLREKKIDFEVVPVALQNQEQHKADYRDRSITGKVPAIDHDGFWLAESSAILEYLEDQFPSAPRLLPTDARKRARARQVMAWVRSDLMALREERSTATMFYEHASTPLSAAGQVAADALVRAATLLVPEGETSLFGEWSIADSDLAFMLHRLLLNGHEVPPKVRAFADAQWRRPSVREFVNRERIPYKAY